MTNDRLTEKVYEINRTRDKVTDREEPDRKSQWKRLYKEIYNGKRSNT